MVKKKRVREPADRSDGYRVLVERLWPRGVRKENLPMDQWAKDIAPSVGLRKWFGHAPERWDEYQRSYRDELRHGAAALLLEELARRAEQENVTLLFSTHDPDRNNAIVLKDEIERRLDRRNRAAPSIARGGSPGGSGGRGMRAKQSAVSRRARRTKKA